MSKIQSMVHELSWLLGVICVVASIMLRLLSTLQTKLPTTPHGGLVMAAVLFLCALATGEAKKTPPSP
jgi:uncharacterized membrane protein YgdD (TMEM256/DUF423 family)